MIGFMLERALASLITYLKRRFGHLPISYRLKTLQPLFKRHGILCANPFNTPLPYHQLSNNPYIPFIRHALLTCLFS